MIALDTNVLVRLFVVDNPAQAKRARALLDTAETFWIPITVMLELGWVLKSQACEPQRVADALAEVLACSNVSPQHPEAVYRALAWFRDGLDLPDALHLALSGHAAQFKTFDERLQKRAAALAISPAVTQP